MGIKICRIPEDLSEDAWSLQGLLRDFLEHLRKKENLKTQDKVQHSDIQTEHLSGIPFCFNFHTFMLVLVTQSCPTLCDPMDCNPPGSSVYEILQARILEWVAIPFSRGSSQPRDWTQVSCTAGRFFTNWATSEAHIHTFRQKITAC